MATLLASHPASAALALQWTDDNFVSLYTESANFHPVVYSCRFLFRFLLTSGDRRLLRPIKARETKHRERGTNKDKSKQEVLRETEYKHSGLEVPEAGQKEASMDAKKLKLKCSPLSIRSYLWAVCACGKLHPGQLESANCCEFMVVIKPEAESESAKSLSENGIRSLWLKSTVLCANGWLVTTLGIHSCCLASGTTAPRPLPASYSKSLAFVLAIGHKGPVPAWTSDSSCEDSLSQRGVPVACRCAVQAGDLFSALALRNGIRRQKRVGQLRM